MHWSLFLCAHYDLALHALVWLHIVWFKVILFGVVWFIAKCTNLRQPLIFKHQI